MAETLDLTSLTESFQSKTCRHEADIKVNFLSDVINPILSIINPLKANQYSHDNRLLSSGKTDATFQHITFIYKMHDYFNARSGVEQTLFGRKNQNSHGLYDDIINFSGFKKSDNSATIAKKLSKVIGVGFDGKTFIFARFIKSSQKTKLDLSKVKIDAMPEVNVRFDYEVKSFDAGLRKLVLLLKQLNKATLSKNNLLKLINSKSTFVRESIKTIYNEIDYNINDLSVSDRIRILYKEWDSVFGVMYGEDADKTDFIAISPAIKEAYGFDDSILINSKMYLFAIQTFFNIFLKLLIYSFLSEIISPAFAAKQVLNKVEIDLLFNGNDEKVNKIISNFFEAHYLEWFTYSDSSFEVDLINRTLVYISDFDLGTYVSKPEEVQDILQEVYMELMPSKMRHLMGEYFSPDWIVEHTLDLISYNGDIDKTLIDPTCGSGAFLTQALKRIITQRSGKLTYDDIKKITHNLAGFDINPISVVSAKANFTLIIISAFFDEVDNGFKEPVSMPIYIADSILSPVKHADKNDSTLVIHTSIGEFEIPKFRKYNDACEFLKYLDLAIRDKLNYRHFWDKITELGLVSNASNAIVKKLFNQLYGLHRSGKDSFWPIVFRNSFAPVMIGSKFDYVVGNPPWIAWKSMSRSYREGTLEVWQSYGIFEKSAYDKHTTHDDFGMAVTYVAIDQYLKADGRMVFLLPATFLKSTKGGQGFRRLSIIRDGQNYPFSISRVDDFSNVRLFTIPTVAVVFQKGKPMAYPLSKYRIWTQFGRKTVINPHDKWTDVLPRLTHEDMNAQPVDLSDPQSAWLTLPDMIFANHVLDSSKPRFYNGRKGIEPAGAKGVYVLKKPTRTADGLLEIENDIARQRRKDILAKGVNKGKIESKYVYPMLGGRNIERWAVKSNEFVLVPHSAKYKYGIPEEDLSLLAPLTVKW